MKTSRGMLVWSALALCAVLVIGAMAWLSHGVLNAEKNRVMEESKRIAAETRADLEERTRLALWRLDALGSAIMLRENQVEPGLYFSPDPRLPQEAPEVILRFRYVTDPMGWSDLEMAQVRDQELKKRRAGNPLLPNGSPRRIPLSSLPTPPDPVESARRASDVLQDEAVVRQMENSLKRKAPDGWKVRRDQIYQNNSSVVESQLRAKAVAKTMENAGQQVQMSPQSVVQQQQVAPVSKEIIKSRPVRVEQMKAVWFLGDMYLRRAEVWDESTGERSDFQCIWLNVAELERQLLKEVADLLPEARLLPVKGDDTARNPLAMASLPFCLERNETPPAAPDLPTPSLGAPLITGWIAVIGAIAMAALLVRGVMRLSERRASFVSAVTHELRTPLTTFRLYSDMLESGAVKPEKRGEYLRVLSREADRLSHLVENVLAFSRLERGNARSNVREVAAGDLLEQSRERLEARLAAAGLTLEMSGSCSTKVRADTTAVEHVLFNLIDNAAKYATHSDPPAVTVSAKQVGRFVEITVSDHGPGIPPAERGRIFNAFHKSAREAAESKPGVGLGLALSKRLAREQGGDLECGGSGRGACFILRLPAAPQAD